MPLLERSTKEKTMKDVILGITCIVGWEIGGYLYTLWAAL